MHPQYTEMSKLGSRILTIGTWDYICLCGLLAVRQCGNDTTTAGDSEAVRQVNGVGL